MSWWRAQSTPVKVLVILAAVFLAVLVLRRVAPSSASAGATPGETH